MEQPIVVRRRRSRAARGYDVTLRGELDFDRKSPAFMKFDLVALGDHWGEGRYTPGARKSRQPLGIVFKLSHGKSASDAVPPQAARELEAYFSTGS